MSFLNHYWVYYTTMLSSMTWIFLLDTCYFSNNYMKTLSLRYLIPGISKQHGLSGSESELIFLGKMGSKNSLCDSLFPQISTCAAWKVSWPWCQGIFLLSLFFKGVESHPLTNRSAWQACAYRLLFSICCVHSPHPTIEQPSSLLPITIPLSDVYFMLQWLLTLL